MDEYAESEPLVGGTPDRLKSLGASNYHMDMNATIYSAIVYAPFVSRIKTGSGMGRASAMVCSMIALNMILQIGLLRLMDIYGHRDSQARRIVAVQSEAYVKTYESFLMPIEKDAVGEASQTKDAICSTDTKGMYRCMPPSVRFTSEWSSLDTDGDGVWTLAEASSTNASNAKPLNYKYHFDKARTVLFNTISRGLKKRAEWLETLNISLYLSQDLLATKGIPKAYFEYWVGDARMCTRFDSNACESIVASGLFDEALKKGRIAAAHKGISDYNSAARYCRMMLEGGGGCAQSLPATYVGQVVDRKHMCGDVSLKTVGVMTNPRNPADLMVVMEPSYGSYEKQKQCAHVTYLFFSILIVFLFYASVVDEIRDLIKTTDFILTYPGVYNSQDRGGIDHGDSGEDNTRFEIQRISPRHRASIAAVLVLRIAILIVLLTYGTWFLLSEKSYLELVMNAVALSFITGIDEMIYAVFMESAEKKDIGFDDCQRLKYRGYIPRDDGSLASLSMRKDYWGLFLLPVISIAVVVLNTVWDRQTTILAMACACSQEGKLCAESMANEGDWWKHYWGKTLPAAIHQIEALRLKGA